MEKKVTAIIIKDKKILLARDKGSDFFSLPGGMIEKEENPETALIRELKEELRTKIKILKHYSTYDYTNTKFNLLQTDITYLVSLDEKPEASSEIAEIKWFSKENIQSRKEKIFFTFLDILFPKLVKEEIL